MRQTKISQASALFLATVAVGLTHGAVARAATPAFAFDQKFFAATSGYAGALSSPANFSSASGVNDSGQIAGWYTSGVYSGTGGANPNDIFRGYVYDTAAGVSKPLTALPSLGGVNSFALAVNAGGQLAGQASDGTANHPVVWNTPAKAVDLGLPSGFVAGRSQAISDNGQAALTLFKNTSFTQYVDEQAYKSVNGQLVQLGTLGPASAHSDAYGINNAGTVVGVAQNPTNGDADVGVYWDGTGAHEIVPIAGSYSEANAINNNGLIVGASGTLADDSDYKAAFVDAATGAIKTVDGLSAAFPNADFYGVTPNSTFANATAVGTVIDADFSVYHAAVYLDGVMYDLNDIANVPAGLTFTYALGINDSGRIVGQARDADGNLRAFSLTLVPEPASLATLAGVAVFGLRRRRGA